MMLRSHVSALEQQLRHASGAGHLHSPTTTAHPTTRADLAAAASSGAGGTSAGAPEQSTFQVRTGQASRCLQHRQLGAGVDAK